MEITRAGTTPSAKGSVDWFTGRGSRTHLPRAVHLVAEAPEFHLVRLLPAVLAPQVRILGRDAAFSSSI